MINVDDIEVFVVTYNRAEMLSETLKSILNQSIQGFKIIVLDNGSTDNTVQVVESFKEQNVFFERSEVNKGHHYNYQRAQEICCKKWSIVFHDDDLMHPDYIKKVLKILNQYPNLASVLGVKKDTLNPDVKNWWRLEHFVIFNDLKDFAASMYGGLSIAFSSTVYKNCFWKRISTNPEKFGKISDTPIIFDSIHEAGGQIAVITDPVMQYRIHDGRDSTSWKTGPFQNEIFALNKEYLKYTGSSPFSKTGRAFISRNFIYLLNSYFWIGKPLRKGIFNFLLKAYKYGATNLLCVIFGVFIGIPRYLIRRTLRFFSRSSK